MVGNLVPASLSLLKGVGFAQSSKYEGETQRPVRCFRVHSDRGFDGPFRNGCRGDCIRTTLHVESFDISLQYPLFDRFPDS